MNVTATEALQCTVMDYITGLYPVHVFVSGKGYASVAPEPLTDHDAIETFDVSPNLVVFLEAFAGNITPSLGSTSGGTHITLTGTGFSHIPSDISVALGGVSCEVISSTRSEITCISGAASSTSTQAVDVSITVNGFSVSNSLQYTYDSSITPQIASIVEGTDLLPGEMIVISGSGFGITSSDVTVQVVSVGQGFDFNSDDSGDQCIISSLSASSIDCTVPSRSAGTYDVKVHVAGVGLASGDATIGYLLAVSSISPNSSGYGGGVTLTLSGEGFPNFDAEDVDASMTSVSVCEDECIIVSSSLNALDCVVSPHYADLPLDAVTSCPIKMSFNVLEAVALENFQFIAELTPMVDSISPTMGGTAGGTTVTIAGAGLLPSGKDSSSLLEQDIVVTIDGAVCEWFGRSTPTDTSIECRTSEHATTLSAQVEVHIAGKGYALVGGSVEDVQFQYVDRWSSPFTWGAGPLPQDGDSVYIQAGQTVFLDVDTAVLNLLLIEGSLIFEDEQDLHLQANYIFINEGKLQVCPGKAGPSSIW